MRFTILLLLVVSSAWADGGLFPGPGYWISETDQIGVIKWETDREELILRIKFEGDAPNFAWILPTPTEPKVDSAGVGLFYALNYFTQPIYKRRGWSCDSDVPIFYPLDGEGYARSNEEVEIIGEGTVGVLEYLILRAEDPSVLYGFLVDNGYHYPDGADSIFKKYIDKNWFYWVAARIDTTQVSGRYYGHLGIKVEFSSSEPVYPLKISRLSSNGSSVTIYTISTHRMWFEDAQLRFAKRISAEDLQDLRDYRYEELADLLYESCFLTKLTKYFSQRAMEDITLKVAPDDKEYREIIFYSGIPILPILVFLRIVKRRKKG